MALTAGKCSGAAVQREIAEADCAQEFEPLGNLPANALGNEAFACAEGQVDGCRERAVQGQRGKVRNGEAAHLHGKRLRAQTPPATGRAGRGGHEVHHVFAIALAARLGDGIAQIGQDAVETCAGRFALGRTIDKDVLLLGRQVLEGDRQIDLVAIGCELDEFEEILRGRARAQSAVEQRLVPVCDDFGWVEIVERAQTVTFRAGAKGGVEAEAARLQLGHVEAAVRAGHRRGEELFVATGENHQHQTIGKL